MSSTTPLAKPARTARKSGLAVNRVKTAYEQVADQLRTLILTGALSPGDQLPVEPQLMATFGVSRSTVREALRSLAAQKLVVTSRGVSGGTFVADVNPSDVSASLATSLDLLSGSKTISVADLLEVRDFFEVPAARLAAERRSDEHLAALQEARRLETEDPNRAHHFDQNHQFHALILDASGNRLLEVITSPIFNVLRTRFLRDAAPAKFWTQVGTDHDEILKCIKVGDGPGAADAMRDHLLHLRGTYTRIDRARE